MVVDNILIKTVNHAAVLQQDVTEPPLASVLDESRLSSRSTV